MHKETLNLEIPAPFAGEVLFSFLAARAVPGVEWCDGVTYKRSLTLKNGTAVVAVRLGNKNTLEVQAKLTYENDKAELKDALTFIFDSNAPMQVIEMVLRKEATLAHLIVETPGLRVAHSPDPYEALVRAIVGQQVSVAEARTVLGHIAQHVGARLAVGELDIGYCFPTMQQIYEADDIVFKMPQARRDTLKRVAEAVVLGELTLTVGVDNTAALDRLGTIKGVGPWTVGYVAIRGLGDPDAFLATDLGVKHALKKWKLNKDTSEYWRPWRTYAMHYLWHSLSS